MGKFLLVAAHVSACLVFLSGAGLAVANENSPPTPAQKTEQKEIQLTTKTGTLHGTIDLPAVAGPFPVVILLPGSGPTDRDGNQRSLKNDCLKQIGQGLAANGIAVCRYDRRGVGQSAAAAPKKEEDFRFEMLVADAADWVQFLEKDARFSGVGIVGHSEGALVGLLAAKRVPVAAYVSLAGAGRSAPEILRKQLGKNLPKEQRAKWEPIVDELAAGHTVADVPKDLASLFRPSVQPYLISLFKYDPAKELADLKIPALIVQGTTDVQETVADARHLAAANKNAELCILDGVNHVMKRAKTDAEQRAAYFDPKVPVDPEVVEKTAEFLKKAFAKRK